MRQKRREVLGRWAGHAVAIAAIAASGACATPGARLDGRQIEALQAEGFVPGDDGWFYAFGEKLLFATDSSELLPEGRSAVERIALALQAAGIRRLRVEGHADAVGEAAYNERLSLRRAEAVTLALVRAGLNREGITPRGLGMHHPVADNRTAAGRAENRRVAIVVPTDQG